MNYGPWGKWHARAFTGSLYGAGTHVFTLLAYCVANAKPPYGVVEINPELQAAMFGCKVKEVEAALEFLRQPDARSRSAKEGGRRLIKLGSFTYKLVNFEEYRAGRDPEIRKAQNREAQRRRRHKEQVSQPPSATHQPQ